MTRPAAGFVALLLAGAAAATVARPVTVEQLAREADAVVQGRVTRMESRWAADGRHIVTRVTVRVSRVLRGAAAGEVTLEIPGGAVGGFGQRVDAAPSFEPGEEAVVFLRRTAAGRSLVHGLAQGKFRILERADGSRVAVRSASDVALLQPGTGALLHGQGRTLLEYADLVAQIEAGRAGKR